MSSLEGMLSPIRGMKDKIRHLDSETLQNAVAGSIVPLSQARSGYVQAIFHREHPEHLIAAVLSVASTAALSYPLAYFAASIAEKLNINPAVLSTPAQLAAGFVPYLLFYQTIKVVNHFTHTAQGNLGHKFVEYCLKTRPAAIMASPVAPVAAAIMICRGVDPTIAAPISISLSAVATLGMMHGSWYSVMNNDDNLATAKEGIERAKNQAYNLKDQVKTAVSRFNPASLNQYVDRAINEAYNLKDNVTSAIPSFGFLNRRGSPVTEDLLSYSEPSPDSSP